MSGTLIARPMNVVHGFSATGWRLDKFPELPFGHDNFGDAVIQHPALQRGQADLIALAEHRAGDDFFIARPWSQPARANVR